MFVRVLLTLLLLHVVESTQRWYYTGKYWPSEDSVNEVKLFPGHVFRPLDLFHPTDTQRQGHILYAGGYVLAHIGNETELEGDVSKLREDAELRGFLAHVTGLHDLSFLTPIYHKYKIHLVHDYSTTKANDSTESADETAETTAETAEYEIFEAEVGLYDHNQGDFLEKRRHSILAGHLHAVQIESLETIHHVIYTSDVYNRKSVIFHTHSGATTATSKEGVKKPTEVENIRIMTYNLWHNNPPSWVFHDPRARWNRYFARMSHFAEVVVDSDPDVIAIQEVRLDSAFFSLDKKMAYWKDVNSTTKTKADSGSQVEHVLSHLHAAAKRKGVEANFDFTQYHFVYQPSMSMWEKSRITVRNEEGLLILSKYPIVESKVLFLPRMLHDPSDDHQRMALVAQIQLPVEDKDGKALITISTSHFSLKESSRDMSVEAIATFFDSDESMKQSGVQIITGDFNAEPHESAIEFLTKPSYEYDGKPQNGFTDSWMEHHGNAKEEATRQGFTFPACNPIKRIDYILVRNNTLLDHHEGEKIYRAFVHNTLITGQQPTADTEHLVGSREGLGMNDLDSPIWASDHYALFTDLRFVPEVSRADVSTPHEEL